MLEDESQIKLQKKKHLEPSALDVEDLTTDSQTCTMSCRNMFKNVGLLNSRDRHLNSADAVLRHVTEDRASPL